VRGKLNVLGVRGRIMLVIMLLAFMVLAMPGRDARPGAAWPALARALSAAGSSKRGGLQQESHQRLMCHSHGGVDIQWEAQLSICSR
jgi:hypothetical protein